MRKVIHRIDAPLVSVTEMVFPADSVQHGVTHIDIGTCHINFCTQNHGTVFKLSVSHALEQVKVFLYTAVTVGGVFSRLRQVAAVLFPFFK